MTAIASRDLSQAKAVANQLGIEKAYGSYDELLADADVDAIYIPLPNHLHVPWSLRAIAAGKHVLCEKPIGMSVAEAEQLADVAAAHPQLKVMEAFMYRFHPQWQTARKLVHDGRIGELRTIHTDFSYFNDDPHNYPQQARNGRRCADGYRLLPDFAVAIYFRRRANARAGTRSSAISTRKSIASRPRLWNSKRARPRSRAARCSRRIQRVNIFGTTGRIEIEIPFNAPPDRPCRMWLQTSGGAGDKTEEILLDVCDQYTLQADAFGRAILEDQPVPTPLEDAVANMRVIERVFTSAETSDWE